jgi:hypothetical protein
LASTKKITKTVKGKQSSKSVKATSAGYFNFPKTDSEFYTWFNSFNKAFMNHYKNFNFTPSQVRAFKSAYNNWIRYYKAWQKAYNAQNRAFEKMVGYRQNATKVMNGFWYRLCNSNWNNGQFANFGIKPKVSSVSSKSVKPKSSKTSTSVRKVSTTSKKFKTSTTYKDYPWVRADWNSAGKVSVYVTANSNGMGKFPTWAKGVALQYRKKGGKWQNLTTTNSWPFIHVVGNTKGGQFEYRAAYAYGNGKLAPWSKTSVAFSKAA